MAKSSARNTTMGNTMKKTAASAKNGKAQTSSNGLKKSSSKATNSENGKGENDSKLKELFVDSLKDIYWAEKSLTKSLPKMSKAATSEDLKNAFNNHLEETQNQIARLESVFEIIGEKAQAKKCEAMAGLTKEAEEMISETDKGSVTRDVALIMAAQKVEHYEIATYGSLATLAAQLGYDDAKELLGETLDEEKNADVLLTDIAVSHINEEAEMEK